MTIWGYKLYELGTNLEPRTAEPRTAEPRTGWLMPN